MCRGIQEIRLPFFFVVTSLGSLNPLNTYAKNKETKRKQEISTEASASVRLILAKALDRGKKNIFLCKKKHEN